MGLDSLSLNDPSSFSNPDEVIIRHAHISWKVDFSRQVLLGFVKFTLEKIKSTANELILDSKDIEIKKVSSGDQVLEFSLGPNTSTFGQRLQIQLPQDTSEQLTVEIHYEISPKATALQWLSPEQTSEKKRPYMFSQCQSIHCRTIMPCQDTPSVKFTYSAEVVADVDLTVLMSAECTGTALCEDDPSQKRHSFQQRITIPSYLLAIVVAALSSRTISPRCAVWAEEKDVDAAAWEFFQTEEMLATAEEICGPYEWGRYDLLVLPPSFGYGGMENPCITFVTPTCVSGDRSLADVIAHEISHSWTGNSVGIKNFEHFWLNEGWTMFVQRKIEAKLFGESHRHFSAILGLSELKDCVMAANNSELETSLVKVLKGIDPEDVFNKVPYEKGHTLLFYLETQLGGKEVFDPFVKKYTQHFRGQPITTDMFKDFLYASFPDKKAILDAVDWQTWFFGAGMPPVIPEYDTTLDKECKQLVQRWITCDEGDLSPLEVKPHLADLSPIQQREFLNKFLLHDTCLSVAKLSKMDQLYSMVDIKNSEVKFGWLRLCIRAEWEAKIPDALKFATSQGRMKFVKPLFRDLYNWKASRQQALDTFEAYKGSLMYITARMVAMDLHVEV